MGQRQSGLQADPNSFVDISIVIKDKNHGLIVPPIAASMVVSRIPPYNVSTDGRKKISDYAEKLRASVLILSVAARNSKEPLQLFVTVRAFDDETNATMPYFVNTDRMLTCQNILAFTEEQATKFSDLLKGTPIEFTVVADSAITTLNNGQTTHETSKSLQISAISLLRRIVPDATFIKAEKQ
jgi:hypothetical protein